jgi:hypothetical protein
MLREQILEAQARYQVAADRNRLPPPLIRIGDRVYVKAKHIPTARPTRKLSDKNLGPFEVIGQHGNYAFTLRLPNYLSRIHPVFHVAQLEPASANPFPGRLEPPLPPEYDEEGNPLFVVAEILNSKYDYRYQKCHLRYFVRWAGYEGTANEFEWVSASDYDPNEDIVVAFHAQNPTKPGPAHLDPDHTRPRR